MTLFIVSVATFGMMHLMPNGVCAGDARAELQPAEPAALTHKLGLDRPLYIQYAHWLDRLVLHFDLGYSYQRNQNVNDLIKETLGQSIYIVGLALFFTILLSVPLGVLQATRRNTRRPTTPSPRSPSSATRSRCSSSASCCATCSRCSST